MRVIAIANRGDADAGFVGERLAYHGARLETVEREELGGLREPEAATDLVVLLGSDWSVYDARHRHAVAAEQALVRRARDSGRPVLAICYGAQLVASTFGLAVTRAPVAEIGWRTIQTTDASLCASGPWFQFHFDRWYDGHGIASGARSAAGPQAFRVGRILAVQFHPEVTAPVARRWLRAQPDEVAATGESVDAIEATLADAMPAARSRCHALIDNFLDRAAASRLAPDADTPTHLRLTAENSTNQTVEGPAVPVPKED